MAAPKKYNDELRERATRLAVEARRDPAAGGRGDPADRGPARGSSGGVADVGEAGRDRRRRPAGLRHAECLALMRLGSPAVSLERMQLRRLAMFAEWEDESALERFLADDGLGRRLSDGWHVRLQYLRRYGEVAALAGLPVLAGRCDPEEPIVAVTLARLKLPELPRFLKWGRPVERLVARHPGTTFATAAVRPPRTFSTFTIWRSVRAMTDMVHGRSAVAQAHTHAVAMAEQHRRDFHHESAFMRFRPLSEHGTWEGRRLLP